MRLPPLTLFAIIDAAVGFGLAFAYVILSRDCAAPFACWFGGACFAVCVNPWTQFPFVLAMGLGIGAIPGAIVYVAERSRPWRP